MAHHISTATMFAMRKPSLSMAKPKFFSRLKRIMFEICLYIFDEKAASKLENICLYGQ